MRVAVCIKQVPDTEARLRVRHDGVWIEEDDVPFVISESDEYALEEGLRVAEATGGEVVVLALGPGRVAEALRKALAMGAARAIHLLDDAFQGGDASTTGRALAAAIRREECQLAITGSQSDDVGWGATGSVIAGELGWPHAWLVMGVEIEDGSCRVVREMEGGLNEVHRLQLPAVIEVQAGINHPRYASLKGIMQAKRKPLVEVTPTELGVDLTTIGAAGRAVEVLSVAFPTSTGEAQIFEGDPATAAKALVEKLQKEARVL